MQKADLEYCKHWFNKYVARFHLLPGDEIQPILLKEQHTMRTCKEIVLLGRELGLPLEDLLLAETAALFHDIGRFPQWEYYSTFIDSESEDHAVLGLEVISRHSVLQRIPPDEKKIILDAIRHHNLRDLPSGLSSRQLLFSRLLRDTDKLDIWKVIIMQQRQHSSLLETLAGDMPSGTSYSRDIVAELRQGRSPDFSYIQNHNDLRLIRLGWVFDLNFAPSCRQVLERNYIEDLCSQLPANREIWELREYLTSYLKERSSPDL